MSKHIKLIQLEDTPIDHHHDYPYIHSVQSHIRFRLRSKLTFDHQPYILIDTFVSFTPQLPLKGQYGITSQYLKDNFVRLDGRLEQDGAWVVDLPRMSPGVVSYQLVFAKDGQQTISRMGSHDTILLCQSRIDLKTLSKQTVFPRCIGRYDKWPQFFKRQHSLGYNAFHLAPIQQTGASNSYYSLKTHIQLSPILFPFPSQQRYTHLQSILSPLKQQGIVFFIDIVLNHTSFDSQWIKEQQASVFTYDNTPMLYTAFLVDQVIYQWGEEVKEMMGLDVVLSEEIMMQIEENLKNRINFLKLEEYFLLSQGLEAQLYSRVEPRKPSDNIFAKDPIGAIQQFLNKYCTKPGQKRMGITIPRSDLQKWKQLNIAYQLTDLSLALRNFNQCWRTRIKQEWIPQIIQNTMGYVRYNYFDNHHRTFDDPYALVSKYFSCVQLKDRHYYALNNGWVDNKDATQMFVVSGEYYYLRRRVNVWGDLLRIRYGERVEDSPRAWGHMLHYVRLMAKYFDGFRMDNLHGTQLSVARYMIRQARKVNPNLIVFAQLFTSSDRQTAVFVKQVGVNSTLKQSKYMRNGDAFLYQFHKKLQHTRPYLGALDRIFIQNGQTIKYAVRKRPITLIYDLTHDNRTYLSQNCHVIQTPLTLGLAMIGTFIGSTKGYDQFYSRHIEVTEMRQLYAEDVEFPVKEERSQIQTYLITYSGVEVQQQVEVIGNWSEWKQGQALTYHKQSKTYYTRVHLPPGHYQYKFKIGQKWLTDELKPTNQNSNHFFNITLPTIPKTMYINLQGLRKISSEYRKKYASYRQYYATNQGNVVVIVRQNQDHLESVCVVINLSTQPQPLTKNIQLNGNVTSAQIWLQSDLAIYQGLITQTQLIHSSNLHQHFQLIPNPSTTYPQLKTPSLPPGFACIITCHKNQSQSQCISSISQFLERDFNLPIMGALELNNLLFGCSRQEEVLYGQGNYVIPQEGNSQLVYGGFGGVFERVLKAKRDNMLSAGLFDNLRQGNWLLDFLLNRLRKFKHNPQLLQLIQRAFLLISSLPRYLIPNYFSRFIYKLLLSIQSQIHLPSDFKRRLFLSSYQFITQFPSSPLLLAAGLPHFSVGWSRSWGRDTFISSDLLLCYPNVFKDTIVTFAGSVRHGLVPNLLDGGNRPRYNCRDASWWFIRAIGEYINKTGDYGVLKHKVEMMFLSDDLRQHLKLKGEGKNKVVLLQQVVQRIVQAHATGISFRQWYAGYDIDSNMTIDGFNISLQVDYQTGFIMGGNPYNCLTWMDKMGSSKSANTKGIPSTPRAGSPVQLVGLLYNCLRLLERWNRQGYFSYDSVGVLGKNVLYGEWADKIKCNFDRWYYLSQGENTQGTKYVSGIYKDLVMSPLVFDQIRFRPNALITLAVAPQLCQPQHAISYLKQVQQHLLKPNSLGVSTLGDMHSIFVPYYDNSDDSSNPKTAHGYSYHNGPQWVWLYGYYIVAKINFQGEGLRRGKMMGLLQAHVKYLMADQWMSLPELTDVGGRSNGFSCRAQAWSISGIVMAVRKIDGLPE